jgi:hypothetical protein
MYYNVDTTSQLHSHSHEINTFPTAIANLQFDHILINQHCKSVVCYTVKPH